MDALRMCLESPEGEVEPLRVAIRKVDVGAVRVGLMGVKKTAGTVEEDAVVE